MVSRTADWTVAEKHLHRLVLTDSVKASMTVLTAGHERKHNVCRADIIYCCSGNTYISRIIIEDIVDRERERETCVGPQIQPIERNNLMLNQSFLTGCAIFRYHGIQKK